MNKVMWLLAVLVTAGGAAPGPLETSDMNARWHTAPANMSLAKVYLRIYLHGAYLGSSDGLMRNKLRMNAFNVVAIPLVSPYEDARSTGYQTPQELPTDVVDWVYIQLRPGINNGVTPTLTLDDGKQGRSVFVRRNGNLVDLDGSDGVILPIADGTYYLIVEHRNHLKVMSAQAVNTANLTDYSTPGHYYDFTIGDEQYYSYNGSKGNVLFNGKWCMAAADGNQPNQAGRYQIENLDYSVWYQKFISGGTLRGYHREDYDLGLQTENVDISGLYSPNLGKRSPFSWSAFRNPS